MITKKNFLQEFNGHSNSYSRYLVINTDIDTIIKTLNEIDPDMCVGSGKEENGNVYCEIFGKTPEIIYTITKKLHKTGYADMDWNATYTLCAENGEDTDNFTAEWDPGMHYYRGDYEEGDDSWDAFVILTDNKSGAKFNTGAGAVSEEIMQYYADIVEKHAEKKFKLRIYQTTGHEKGNIEREEFFLTKEEMDRRYNELFVYDHMSFNPTKWEMIDFEWNRIEGF